MHLCFPYPIYHSCCPLFVSEEKVVMCAVVWRSGASNAQTPPPPPWLFFAYSLFCLFERFFLKKMCVLCTRGEAHLSLQVFLFLFLCAFVCALTPAPQPCIAAPHYCKSFRFVCTHLSPIVFVLRGFGFSSLLCRGNAALNPRQRETHGEQTSRQKQIHI